MTLDMPVLYLDRGQWQAMVRVLDTLYYGAQVCRTSGRDVPVCELTGEKIAVITPAVAPDIITAWETVKGAEWHPGTGEAS